MNFHLSKVNADDNDGGILYGNWSGDYYGGTQPTSWSGSGAILEQYWRTKRAVKWAQCWVFGGTLTSGEGRDQDNHIIKMATGCVSPPCSIEKSWYSESSSYELCVISRHRRHALSGLLPGSEL